MASPSPRPIALMSPAVRSESPSAVEISASRSRCGHPQPIAALQHQVRGGHDVDVAAAHPADHRVEPLLHPQVPQLAADVAEFDSVTRRKSISLRSATALRWPPAQLPDQVRHDVLAGRDGQQIPGGQRFGLVRDDGPVPAGEPRDHGLVPGLELVHRAAWISDEFEVRTTMGASFSRSSAVGLRLPALIRYEHATMVSSTVIRYATA